MNRCPLSWLLRAAFPLILVGLAILLARATVLAQLGDPTVNIVAKATVSESAGTVAVSVMLMNPPPNQSVTVHYATANASATAPADYTHTEGDITWPAGNMEMKTITVPIADDGDSESDETFTISLSNCQGAAVGNGTCTVTISGTGGGGGGGPTVQFSMATYTVLESAGSASIGVTLTPASSQTVTVSYSVTAGTATVELDYKATASGTLTFAPGETSQSIPITIMPDSDYEGNETVALSLSNPSNATLGAPSSAELTITDDESPPQSPTLQFSSSTYSVNEADGTKTITVTLSVAAAGPVSVEYATSDGASNPATAGSDYTSASGTLNFAAGETSQTFSVTILQDSISEDPKTVTLSLSNPSGVNLGFPNTATLTITDDEPPPRTVQFIMNEFTVGEGSVSTNLGVMLNAASTVEVTVSYTVANGTATAGTGAGADYTATASGTLTFPAGETMKTITVTILQDTTYEGKETVNLTLSSPTNATLGSPSNAVLTINDDDPVSPVIVTATGGTFSPDPAPIGTTVSTTLSAQALRPSPSSGCTLGDPSWTWTFVSAAFSDDSENGPWTNTVNGYSCQINSASSPPPDSSYDYSAVQLVANFSEGAFWKITLNAQVTYIDSGGQQFVGAAQADAKGMAVKLISLTVSQGATQTNVTGVKNWAAIKKSGEKVTVKATLKPDTEAAAGALDWTGGSAVSGKKRERTVDRGTSAKTNVKATVGPDSKDLDIWIIWATMSIQVEGKAPNPPFDYQCGVVYTPDEKSATDANGNICAIATITPVGINAVVTKGWDMKRDKMRHNFMDGKEEPGFYGDVWIDDTSVAKFKTTVPDANDKLYDGDGPNVAHVGAKDSVEVNFNARQFVTWNDVECSDKDGAAAKWYWRARWKSTETPQVTAAQVGLSNLDLSLYTKAEYPVP